MKRVKLSSVPTELDAFLDWFRERTEAVWASLPVRAPEEIVAVSLKIFENEEDAPTYEEEAGLGWQPGTRWLGGLSSEAIAEAEKRWGVRFPADYRLFLQRLHAPDRPGLCTGFASKAEPKSSSARSELARAPYDEYNDMVLYECGTGYYDWSTDTDAMHEEFDQLAEAIKRAPKRIPADAPKLLPVDTSPHYLLAEPCVAGNPVFWVGRGEMGVCAADLRDYLLTHFCYLLDLTFEHRSDEVERAVERRVAESYDRYRAIPFWGELL